MAAYIQDVRQAFATRWKKLLQAEVDKIKITHHYKVDVSYRIDSEGQTRDVRILPSTSSPPDFIDLCLRTMHETVLPKPPAEVLAHAPAGSFDQTLTFHLLPPSDSGELPKKPQVKPVSQ